VDLRGRSRHDPLSCCPGGKGEGTPCCCCCEAPRVPFVAVEGTVPLGRMRGKEGGVKVFVIGVCILGPAC
jgi:hypothetical protein